MASRLNIVKLAITRYGMKQLSKILTCSAFPWCMAGVVVAVMAVSVWTHWNEGIKAAPSLKAGQ